MSRRNKAVFSPRCRDQVRYPNKDTLIVGGILHALSIRVRELAPAPLIDPFHTCPVPSAHLSECPYLDLGTDFGMEGRRLGQRTGERET